jgi:hypothetical protein
MAETDETLVCTIQEVNNQPYFTRLALRALAKAGKVRIKDGKEEDIVKFYPFEKKVHERFQNDEFSPEKILHFVEYEFLFQEMLRVNFEYKGKNHEKHC